MLFQKHKIFLLFKNFFLTFSFLSIIYFAQCQQSVSVGHGEIKQFAATITTDDLFHHISILTADSLEGRETGKPGQKKAAAYIREQFIKFGLKPAIINGKETYEQEFTLPNYKKDKISLSVDGKVFFHLSGFVHGGKFRKQKHDTIYVNFAGYGTPDILDNIRSEGEAVMFLNSHAGPGFHEGIPTTLHDRITIALEHGYSYIFIVYGETSAEFGQFLRAYKYAEGGDKAFIRDQGNSGHVFFISPDLGALIFNTDMDHLKKAAEKGLHGARKPFRKLQGASLVINAQPQDSIILTENVIGYIEGREEPGECVIISAHYDHVGIRGEKIHPGADDNASGTAALMEIAEGFSIASQKGMDPDRSILFIAFTGEEKGLLGSGYYVDHPVFPLEKTIANLNIDMIGRSDTLHGEDSSYVYLIGSDKLSPELHEISEKSNQEYTNLSIDYTFNRDEDPNRFYYRSDQYNFAKNNIPVIFYFTGVHEDYHKPSDTLEKIRFDNMLKISQLIFYTSWEIANREDRLKLR
ncbi:MAG: M28 family peptidase [Cyclobacteriaceae bacterium]|nr:M28 family peptidase [Cyclobacteriaceae bacterium]